MAEVRIVDGAGGPFVTQGIVQMGLPVHTDPPRLSESEDGVVRIAGTRIPLERVIRAFLAGSTPEQILQDYDVLAIEDVYAVVNYYLHHRGDVDRYLANAEQEAAKTRDAIERTWDPAGIRARLLAKRAGAAS
jgi:uncharacterized protein (DUF433 family)